MQATVIDSQIYKDIFSSQPMRALFSDESRLQKFLEVEVALAKVQADFGIIPKEAYVEIKEKAKSKNFDLIRLKQETELIGYPVLPVIRQLVALCEGELGQYCHFGATTQDVTDTALMLQIKEGLALIEADLATLTTRLEEKAETYKETPMVGRSNLQQATPITFGYKVATWLSAFYRHQERLKELKLRALTGEFGGACGTLASLGKEGLKVQKALMDELGLLSPLITFHTIRDQIAEIGCFLGLLSASLAKISLDIKLMMQTEINEVREPFTEGRGSSSTMPHKRNPITCNFIHAIAASVRQQVPLLIEAMEADHERSTGPWEIEWMVIPEIFCLSGGALKQAIFLIEGLVVDEHNMRKNLENTQGFICTEAVMMALSNKIGRQRAHDLIYKICHLPQDENKTLIDRLTENNEISQHLTREELVALLNPNAYTGLASKMVEKLLAKKYQPILDQML